MPPEGEGILSMYVVLDPDKQTSDDYLVIRDRTNLNSYFSSGHSTYYVTDGINGAKHNINFNYFSNITETTNQHRMTLEKSRELDNSSKENIFTKMENNTSTNTEPIVINNQQEVNDDLGSEDPSYVSQVGDPGLNDFYPSPY